jgi:PST family polysaccharide transporter
MTTKSQGAGYLNLNPDNRDIKQKALRGSAAMIISRSVSTLLQFGGTIVLARLLAPNDFGLFAMVTAFSLFLANVGYNGFIEAIVQADEIDHLQISTLFWLNIGIGLSLAILLSALSPLLAGFYKEPRLISIALALSLGIVLNALTTTHLALIMRQIEFRKVMMNEIISLIFSNSLAVLMAVKGFGYWALVVRQLVWTLSSASISWIQCAWRPSWPQRGAKIKGLVRYAAHTFANFGINYIGRNLDKVLIGWRWGSQELGSYDRAYQLFVLPVGQMVTPLAGVALSTLSRLRDDPERYRRYYLRSLSIIAFIGMLVSVILTIAGQDIIVFLLGRQWTKAGQIFTAFGPSVGITLIYGTHAWLHLSLGKPQRWLRWSLFALAMTAGLFLIGLKYGGLGIAVAYGLSYYLLVGPALAYAGKPVGIRPRDIWTQLWRYYLASVLSGALVWLAFIRAGFLASPSGSLPLLIRILAICLASTTIYSLAILAMYPDGQPFKDILSVLKEVLPSPKTRLDDHSHINHL